MVNSAELTHAQRLEVGFVQLRDVPGRPWTHPLGDEHAARILSGEIPFEDAKAQHQAALEEFHASNPRFRGSV